MGHNAPVAPGAWVVAASAAVALLIAFPLRTRLPAMGVVLALAVAGAGLGWGGMLLQPHPSTGEFVAAPILLAVLVPAHARIVLGPFGPGAAGRASGSGPPARGRPAGGRR